MRPLTIHSELSQAARDQLRAILEQTNSFGRMDFEVALDLLNLAVSNPTQRDYRFLIAEEPSGVIGYICYGPTPMTLGTYDLYWIVVDPRHQRQGIARALIEAMEQQLKKADARMIRVETSSKKLFDAARRVYLSAGYSESAKLVDFYSPGDDLVIFTKRLEPLSASPHLTVEQPSSRVVSPVSNSP